MIATRRFDGEVQPVHMEQRELEVAIARQVSEAVAPGWDSVRFEVGLAGNVTSGMLYTRFPRAEASAPSWWRERIVRGDE